MSSRGDFGGRSGTLAAYTPNQVEAVLKQCDIEVVGETSNDLLCLCPFHGNRNTPSFSVSREHGSFICFNHSCGVTGTLIELVKTIGEKNEFEARRMILKAKTESADTFEDALAAAFAPAVEFVEFPQQVIDKMYEDFWKTPHAIEYMQGRGFTEETLRYFKIGYSAKKRIIAVPMHTDKGVPIGVIGRPASKAEKFFKNSKNLPTSKTLWNLHRAKRAGGTVIVVESSFDAMRLHQAGFANVVATLGGNFSPYHQEQLGKYFDTIIVMTDNDDKKFYEGCRKCVKIGLKLCKGHNPGRDLGATIASKLARKRIFWASFDNKMVYPHGAKDAGDLTDDEIRQCIRNAVSNYEYVQWQLY